MRRRIEFGKGCLGGGGKVKIAIQGELGSNSHMAALAMLEGETAAGVAIAACATYGGVFERVVSGSVDGAVLPIENSLHGSVAEHYDLLLAQPVRIASESLLRVRHNLIVRPGVAPADVKRVMSHPVALSQCRQWLAAHPWFEVVNFYDTAGSVKHLMAEELDDTAGIASELAARQYGAEVLVAGIEDHAENYTRFHLLLRDPPLCAMLAGVGRGRWREQGESGFQRRASAGIAGAGAGGVCRGGGEPDQDRVSARCRECRGSMCFLSICGLNRRRRWTLPWASLRAIATW